MSLTGNLETNALGGGGFGGLGIGGGGFGGGFGGGIAPFGLFGLVGGFGDRGREHGCNDNSGLVLLNAIGNLKDTVFNAKDSIDERLDSVRDSLSSRVENVGDRVTFEGRNISDRVADANVTNLQQFYAQAIQAERNTQQLSTQAQAFAIVADKRFDDLAAAGVNQTAAVLARINDVENQNLRDQLFESRRGRDRSDLEIQIQNTNTNTNAQFQAQTQAQLQAQLDEHRRRWDSRENEISIVNTNTNINAQAQAQAQAQAIRDLDRDHRWNARFDALLSQQNKVGQDIVNIGGLVAANQTSTPTNNTVGQK